MANPIWLTGQGQLRVDLGTVSEGSYFEYPLDSYDPTGGLVTYKFLAGELPPGIRINKSGLIQGGPYLNTVENKTSSYEFTVRASDHNGLIADKTFTMTVANIVPPVITPRITDLGDIFDGEYFSLQLLAIELNPYAELTWELESGQLPNGLSLSSSGLISGFIIPLETLGNAGLSGFNANPYNEFAFENSPTYQNTNYQFTIRVYDGANYDSLSYKLTVNAKDHYSADNTTISIDNTHLSIDNNNTYVPIMTTPSQALPEVRSNSKFAFKFEGLDPSGSPLNFSLSVSSSGAAGFDQGGVVGFDTIGFDQENLSIPAGLILDPETGWLSGTIGGQVAAIQEYTFQVYCYQRTHPEIQSVPVTYTMTILGDITNTISWTTSSNLGVIDNGAISELSVSAINNSGRSLTYSLVTANSHLPQGLELQRSGLIVGRAGFEYFSLDKGTTTVDGSVSNFDNVYDFIVQATTTDKTSSSQQAFTIKVNNYNSTPYENIYIKALPSLSQRNTFLSIVNNTDIFPESLIYRPTDPNFGRARDIRSLFLAGLSPTSVQDYIRAISTNNYSKRIEFSDVKTAIAVDSKFNTKYEVVYIELKDDAVYRGKTPANNRVDPVINRTIYPNSFKNMSSVISDVTGFENQGAIPDWMSSPQTNKRQLGFTRAIVLAYTVPGASKLIAYRLAANGVTFNDINFVVDRYDLDNSYSVNYDIGGGAFDLGLETTFDRIIRPGYIATSVTYGVRNKSFSMINNRTVSEINAAGGIDGVTDYANSDTIIFLQQENYPGESGSYDGWTNTSIIPGWVENASYPTLPLGTSGLPASPEVKEVAELNGVYYMFSNITDTSGNIIDTVWKVANLRANPWVINITNNVVTLTPKVFLRTIGSGVTSYQIPSMIIPADRVQINHGKAHSESIVYYDLSLLPGNSVPAYSDIPTMLATAGQDTFFDGRGTRFINNRIMYTNPEIGDYWLKFPNEGPLL